MSALPKGRHRWLTNPSSVAVLAGLVVAIGYVSAVLTIPEGTRGWFFGLFISVGLFCNFLGDLIEQRRLRTIKGLSDGTLSPTVELLAAAAHEAARAPQVSFVLALSLLTGGTALIAVLWYAASSPPLLVLLRIVLVSVLVAPLSAMMANLLMLPRARQVLRDLLAAGLPPAVLAAQLPPTYQLRRRLVTYAAIAVLTPMMIMADASLHRASELLDRVRAVNEVAAGRAVFEAQRGEGFGALAALGAVTVLLVVLCGWLAGSVLGDPLKQLAKETERLAAARYEQGRLVVAELEAWAAACAMYSMEGSLLEAVNRARDTSRGITAASAELVQSGAAQEQGAAEQSAALMATTATTEELARSARQIAANAQRVSELARGTFEAAQGGRRSAEAFTFAMSEVRLGNQAIADSVVRLNKRVQQVGRIIEFIDGIADKSDLLALNAELEGHKAGAVGQGFGLVAAEMRRLAENVMRSTREIARLIEDIRDATNAAVMATEAGVKATDSGSALAAKVRDALGNIVEFANLSSDAMQSISLATVQQEAGTEQLVAAMDGINGSTRRGVESASDMARTQADLVTLAKELETAVETLGRRT